MMEAEGAIILVVVPLLNVVPAKAGTHTPCRLVNAIG